jgi:uncharacterized lipoprotein YmbA
VSTRSRSRNLLFALRFARGRFVRRTGVGLAVLGLVFGSACGILDPRPDKVRFFVLAEANDVGGPPASRTSEALSVGLGPVALPEYVRRSSIVTRSHGTEIVPSPDEHWAEPIEEAVVRVLARDLALALGISSVTTYPWYADAAPGRQVRITLSRFEREDGGRVVLVALWQIIDTSTRAIVIERESHFAREAKASGDSGGAPTAAALSSTLADLAREIAAALSEKR